MAPSQPRSFLVPIKIQKQWPQCVWGNFQSLTNGRLQPPSPPAAKALWGTKGKKAMLLPTKWASELPGGLVSWLAGPSSPATQVSNKLPGNADAGSPEVAFWEPLVTGQSMTVAENIDSESLTSSIQICASLCDSGQLFLGVSVSSSLKRALR